MQEPAASATTPSAQNDYRNSHLAKGEDYDRDLSRGDFNTYMTDREKEILTRVVSRLFPGGVPRYLDFACGTGRITSMVAPLAKEVFGVDVSANMIEQARLKVPQGTFLVRDLTTESAGIPPVNLVTSFRFFGDAQDELRRGALRAIHDLLVPGGYLIINSHLNPQSLHNMLLRASHKPVHGDLRWSQLRRLLEAGGFRTVERHGIGLWLVRHKWNRPEVLQSTRARLLEPLSRIKPLTSFCPDAVIVAQRRS